MYRDLDQFVKEHVERGFICIRPEGGTGLTHVKTLCGPEDTCWTQRKDKLRERNGRFLAEE